MPHPVILSWTTHTESLGGGRAGWRDGLSPYHSATPKPASAPPTKHRPLLSRPLRPQTRPFCQRPVAEAGSPGGGAGCGWLAFVSGESWEGLGGSCREHIHVTFSAATWQAATGLAAGMSFPKAKAEQRLPLKQDQIELPGGSWTHGGVACISAPSQRSCGGHCSTQDPARLRQSHLRGGRRIPQVSSPLVQTTAGQRSTGGGPPRLQWPWPWVKLPVEP